MSVKCFPFMLILSFFSDFELNIVIMIKDPLHGLDYQTINALSLANYYSRLDLVEPKYL